MLLDTDSQETDAGDNPDGGREPNGPTGRSFLLLALLPRLPNAAVGISILGEASSRIVVLASIWIVVVVATISIVVAIAVLVGCVRAEIAIGPAVSLCRVIVRHNV